MLAWWAGKNACPTRNQTAVSRERVGLSSPGARAFGSRAAETAAVPGKQTKRPAPQRTVPREADMSSTPAGASTTVVVTILGLLTLLVGGGYLAMGGVLVWSGAAMATDAAGGWGPLLQVFAGLSVVLAVPFLLQGVLGLLAGGGVLLRK